MKCATVFVFALLLEITSGYSEGVRECRDGVKVVLDNFPEPTKKEGETIWSAFDVQTQNLQNLTTSVYSILSINAEKILNALAKLSNAGVSPTNLLYQLKKVYPSKAACYRSVALSLKAFIGTLESYINTSVDDVAISILDCLDAFERRRLVRKERRCERIDFKSLVSSSRLNTNTIAFIADVAVKDSYADETYQSIAIISLIANLLLLSVHGTNANIGTVLHSEDCDISPTLRKCYEALDPLVDEITNLIRESSFDSVAGLKTYLRRFADIIFSYNPSLEKLIGRFAGVGFTEATVKRNLKK